MAKLWALSKLFSCDMWYTQSQGLAVIFSHRQVYVKRHTWWCENITASPCAHSSWTKSEKQKKDKKGKKKNELKKKQDKTKQKTEKERKKKSKQTKQTKNNPNIYIVPGVGLKDYFPPENSM